MAKCSAADLEVGEHISTTVYYTVVTKMDGKTTVKDSETGDTLVVSNAILERESYSALQHTSAKDVTRTDAVHVLQNAGDTVFKCIFTKKDGSKRVMIARRIPGIPGDTCFGRTECFEIKEDGTTQRRQIDHRTLESILWKGVLYTVK